MPAPFTFADAGEILKPLDARKERLMGKLTPRQEAEAIEQFGDDLIKLGKAFDKLCERMSSFAIEAINAIEGQDELDTIARAIQALGDRMCRDIDRAEEAA